MATIPTSVFCESASSDGLTEAKKDAIEALENRLRAEFEKGRAANRAEFEKGRAANAKRIAALEKNVKRLGKKSEKNGKMIDGLFQNWRFS